MRSAAQIGRTVGEWHDHQRGEREKALREFLAACRKARMAGEPWVAWIDAGCPDVTTPEGARFASLHAPARKTARDGARP